MTFVATLRIYGIASRNFINTSMAKINSFTQQTWCVFPQICKWENPDDVKVIYGNGAVRCSIKFSFRKDTNLVLYSLTTVRAFSFQSSIINSDILSSIHKTTKTTIARRRHT